MIGFLALAAVLFLYGYKFGQGRWSDHNENSRLRLLKMTLGYCLVVVLFFAVTSILMAMSSNSLEATELVFLALIQGLMDGGLFPFAFVFWLVAWIGYRFGRRSGRKVRTL